jgi:hypothetical protein
MPRYAKAAALIGVMVLTGLVFYRVPISNGFSGLWGDHFDGGIEAAIMEHWYNVVRGYSPWMKTFYFYPATDTIGYNDGFLLYGLIYSVFRPMGYDMFVSAELADMVVRAVGFVSFYLSARAAFSFSFAYALLGAAVFSIAHSGFMHAFHQQLTSIAFAPLLAYLAFRGYQSLANGSPNRFALYGAVIAVLYSGWCLSGFYMAWFFGLFCLTLPVVGPIAGGLPFYRSTFALFARFKWHTAFVVIALAVAMIPVFLVYIPKARETGMHDWAGVSVVLPRPNDALNVGTDNFMFGRFFKVLCRYCTGENNEDMTGIPPIQMYVFLCAVAWALFRCKSPHAPLLRAIAIATMLTWMLLFRYGRHSGWRLIFDLVPGAKGVRVLGRYQIFLTWPIVVLSIAYLQTIGARMPRTMITPIGSLMLLEQLGTSPHVNSRADILARIDVPPPPPACNAFFTTKAKGQDASSDFMTRYPQNVEAMLIAESIHLSTINGYATFLPPGWNFEDPTRSDYLQRVLAYAQGHKVRGLCELDLETLRWSGPVT